MHKLKFNIESESEDKRIPLALASKVMGDVQSLLYHAGGYLVSKEMRLQGYPDKRLLNKFTLYVGGSSAETVETSTSKPSTSGFGNIVDDAAELVVETLMSIGSGTGGYWADDKFTHPIYRNQIVADVITLHDHLSEYPGYYLTFGYNGEAQRLGEIDVDKLVEYVKKKGRTSAGATVGIIHVAQTKSRGSLVSLDTGYGKAKLAFFDAASRTAAEAMADKGAVIVAGTMTYSKDNVLTEITQAGGVTAFDNIKFRRMISSSGDVELKAPVEATVEYNGGAWILKNENLGIFSSKPDWDTAVQSFHDYFVFLWEQYSSKPEEDLDEEEAEIKEELLKLVM